MWTFDAIARSALYRPMEVRKELRGESRRADISPSSEGPVVRKAWGSVPVSWTTGPQLDSPRGDGQRYRYEMEGGRRRKKDVTGGYRIEDAVWKFESDMAILRVYIYTNNRLGDGKMDGGT